MPSIPHRQVGRCKFAVLAVLIATAALGASCASGVGGTTLPRAVTETPGGREMLGSVPETAQWKDFSSDALGFQFRYPASCAVTELNGSFSVGGRIELTVLDSGGMSLSDYVTRFVDDKVRNGSWQVESTRSGVLSGTEAITVDYRFGGPKRFGTATFALTNAKVYVWGLTAGGETCDESKVYGTVLSSFRFTKCE